LRPHRKTEGFNLAFLDIMACGLGAVVLVFMLVKHNVVQPDVEAESLDRDVQLLVEQKRNLEEDLSQLKSVSTSNRSVVDALQGRLAKLETLLAQEKTKVSEKKVQLTALKKDISSRPIKPVANREDSITDDRGGEEEYLIGLKVEGRRILVLVDSSASMTDEKLLDIIKRKIDSDGQKKQGPKWLRTKKIVRWIIARAPNSSSLSVIYFNESVQPTGSGRWVSPGDVSAIQGLYKELDKIVPEGGTNLQKGLKAVSRNRPTDLYLITDGLPTLGDSRYTSLNPFVDCNSLLGKSETISGECRVKLFRQTIKESSPQGVKTHVILLPIEGDPEAVNEYWSWAALTGGLVISPAVNWP
jgi:hypothetical protein